MLSHVALKYMLDTKGVRSVPCSVSKVTEKCDFTFHTEWWQELKHVFQKRNGRAPRTGYEFKPKATDVPFANQHTTKQHKTAPKKNDEDKFKNSSLHETFKPKLTTYRADRDDLRRTIIANTQKEKTLKGPRLTNTSGKNVHRKHVHHIIQEKTISLVETRRRKVSHSHDQLVLLKTLGISQRHSPGCAPLEPKFDVGAVRRSSVPLGAVTHEARPQLHAQLPLLCLL